jgi:hypothetical protein
VDVPFGQPLPLCRLYGQIGMIRYFEVQTDRRRADESGTGRGARDARIDSGKAEWVMALTGRASTNWAIEERYRSGLHCAPTPGRDSPGVGVY